MKNYKSKFENFYLYLFSFSFIFFLLYTSFYLVCFINVDSLYNLICKYQTYKNLPFELDFESLKLIARELMQYISGSLTFLETKVTINGSLTEFYSLRSKIHMADVRNIIVTLKQCNFVAIFICIFSIFKIFNSDDIINKLKKAYKRCMLIMLILLSLLLIYAAFNFDVFFIKFHELLFTNDLWLLDPDVDYIICLLPEKIFMVYGFRIIVAMFIAISLPLLCLYILSKIQLPQEAK